MLMVFLLLGLLVANVRAQDYYNWESTSYINEKWMA